MAAPAAKKAKKAAVVPAAIPIIKSLFSRTFWKSTAEEIFCGVFLFFKTAYKFFKFIAGADIIRLQTQPGKRGELKTVRPAVFAGVPVWPSRFYANHRKRS